MSIEFLNGNEEVHIVGANRLNPEPKLHVPGQLGRFAEYIVELRPFLAVRCRAAGFVPRRVIVRLRMSFDWGRFQRTVAGI